MAQAFSVSWFHMEPLDAQLLKDLKQQFLGLRYSEELGYGFRGVLLEDSYLSAVLVKRTATFIPQLDVTKGELVDREIFLFSERVLRSTANSDSWRSLDPQEMCLKCCLSYDRSLVPSSPSHQ